MSAKCLLFYKGSHLVNVPQLLQQKTYEESLCFMLLPFGIFGQLHSLISLFCLVRFTVSQIFQLTATASHSQTSKWTQGMG